MSETKPNKPQIFITFSSDEQTKRYILGLIGLNTDKDGYIIDQNNKRIQTPDGEYIHISEFGGITKDENGNTIYLKDNIIDILNALFSQSINNH